LLVVIPPSDPQPAPGQRAPIAPDSANPAMTPAVASARHTTILTAIFLGLAVMGAVSQRAGTHPGSAPSPPPVLPLYISLMAGEWGLFLYVWRAGLRRRGTSLLELVGGEWGSAQAVLRDALLAVGLWGGTVLLLAGMERVLHTGQAAPISGFLPRRPVEMGLWVLLSLSAGFCEELIFRGYFMRQFAAWTRSRWIGLLLQALLFGVSHGYQGVAACIRITVFGVLFGLMAMWRRSLRPGMMAHALTDILGGIFRI